MTRRELSLMAAFLAAGSAIAAGQAIFRGGVDLVEVDVSVTRGGVPVANLTAENFVVTDNGVRQEVTTATLDLPLRVTLVLDVSESVSGERLSGLVKAGNGLVNALKAEDQASLVTFSHRARLQVPMTASFDALRDALSSLSATGSTSLRDAVYLAMTAQGHEGARRLVLVFSDGIDTASWLTNAQVIEAARRSSVVIHVVRFGIEEFLDRLANETGGRTWSAGSDRQLEELFTRALNEMRARYVLTYSVRAPNKPGWHKIEVGLRNARGDVTARPGYIAP
jgi:Ca-activated chloride channel homolog